MTWQLDELIPHRPPMVLLDAVESFDPDALSLTARVTITPESLFCEPEGVPNWVAIEYMAQTAAALVGCYDRTVAPDTAPAHGLFLMKVFFEPDDPRSFKLEQVPFFM